MVVLQFGFGGGPRNPHRPENHVELLVVYTGTHDTDTAVGWWDSLSPRARAATGPRSRRAALVADRAGARLARRARDRAGPGRAGARQRGAHEPPGLSGGQLGMAARRGRSRTRWRRGCARPPSAPVDCRNRRSGAGAAERHARAIAHGSDRDHDRDACRPRDVETAGIGEPDAQLVAPRAGHDAHPASDLGLRITASVPRHARGAVPRGAISIVNPRPPALMNSGRLLEYGNRTFGKGESFLAFESHESASLELYSRPPGWIDAAARVVAGHERKARRGRRRGTGGHEPGHDEGGEDARADAHRAQDCSTRGRPVSASAGRSPAAS